MFIIRWVLGRVILFFNWVFTPQSPKRELSVQQAIDIETQSLSLYQLAACPFCVKVRREMKRKGLNIELKNINVENAYLEELVEQGGKRTVPCLKIANENGNFEWLYESGDIIKYLGKFSS